MCLLIVSYGTIKTYYMKQAPEGSGQAMRVASHKEE